MTGERREGEGGGGRGRGAQFSVFMVHGSRFAERKRERGRASGKDR